VEKVVRERRIPPLVAAFAVVAAAAPAAADTVVSSTYLRERASVTWVVPARTDRHVTVYTVSGATYQNLETGTTVQFADITRSRCVVSGGARECGVPQVEEHVTPKVFDVADDLSKANLELEVDSKRVSVKWLPHPVTGDAESFLPLAAEYRESCPEGSGEGRGLYRRMQVSGSFLGKRFAAGSRLVVRSWVDRAVMRTECQRP
jgi:hypothetical protein